MSSTDRPTTTSTVTSTAPTSADTAAGRSHARQHQRQAQTTHRARSPQQRAVGHQEPTEEEMEEFQLKYGAEHVIRLFVPVSLCMFVVVLTISTITFYSRDDRQYLLYTPFTQKTDSAGVLFLQSMGNALIILGVVVVMTFVLILLYKFRLYKVIYGWLVVSSLLMLTMFSMFYAMEVLRQLNIAVDFITMSICLWNWGVMGMCCIHWKGPLRLQQFYLIVVSALMSLIFIKFLPEWTAWAVLGILAVWDLVAVLCPFGPLRILVETAQERNEPLFPALVYSSGIMYTAVMLSDVNLVQAAEQDEEQAAAASNQTQSTSTDTQTASGGSDQRDRARDRRNRSARTEGVTNPQLTDSDRAAGFDERWQQRTNQAHANAARSLNGGGSDNADVRIIQPTAQQQQEDDDDQGVKLGLGDFIFYSVLVGRASAAGDWSTTLACYVSILIGLCLTLVLLAVFKKALPALPISIFFGLIFYFSTSYVLAPFTNAMAVRQILL